MLEKIVVLALFSILLSVSGLLLTNHLGLAIMVTNYTYLLIALFFLFKLFKPKYE